MTLVNEEFSLSCIKFRCLTSNRTYTITGSLGSGRARDTIDTIVRDDGEKIRVERTRLVKRFNNIEKIEMFYDYRKTKRSKAKR